MVAAATDFGNGRVSYTVNAGKTWTSVPIGKSDSVILQSIWVPTISRHVALYDSTSLPDNGAGLISSADGITWDGVGSAIVSYPPVAVQWAKGLGKICLFDAHGVTKMNPDLSTGLSRNEYTGLGAEPNHDYEPEDVAWSPALGLFVAPLTKQSDGTSAIGTSTDGVAWTVHALPADTKVNMVEWVPGVDKFFAFYYWTVFTSEMANNPFSKPVLVMSSNGVDWVAPTTMPGTYTPRSVQDITYVAPYGYLALAVKADYINGLVVSYDGGATWSTPWGAGNMFVQWFAEGGPGGGGYLATADYSSFGGVTWSAYLGAEPGVEGPLWSGVGDVPGMLGVWSTPLRSFAFRHGDYE
jgi:hypothetical protein